KNAATIQARHPARRNAADGEETESGRGLTTIQVAAELADCKRIPPKTAASGAGSGVTRSDLSRSTPPACDRNRQKAGQGGVCRCRAGSLTACLSEAFPR